MVIRCGNCEIEKPVAEFYLSNRARCKACVRATAKRNRLAKLETVRAYDRERAKLPHRIANAIRVTREWRRQHRDRLKAHNAAARAKLVKPTACEGCGHTRPLNKHHHDYSKPLLVMWLCKPCHAIADKLRRKLESA